MTLECLFFNSVNIFYNLVEMVSFLFIVVAVSSVAFLSTKVFNKIYLKLPEMTIYIIKVNPADTESLPINDGFKIRKKVCN